MPPFEMISRTLSAAVRCASRMSDGFVMLLNVVYHSYVQPLYNITR
jgi:hypothetical protein